MYKLRVRLRLSPKKINTGDLYVFSVSSLIDRKRKTYAPSAHLSIVCTD